MLQKFSFFLLLLMCFGCNPTPKDSSLENANTQDTYEILSLVLKESVGRSPQSWLENAVIEVLLPGSKEDSIQKAKKSKLEKSNSSEPATIVVFIDDSLWLPHYHADDLKSYVKSRSFAQEFPAISSSHEALLTTLAQQKKTAPVQLDKLICPEQFELRYASVIDEYVDNNSISIGTLTMSNVVFNTANTSACVYGQFISGNLSGFGLVYFLEKQDGNWKILRKKVVWIA